MAFSEYESYDGLGLADLVRKGEVLPADLVEEAIARIERHNPKLNAVIYNAFDEARTAAKGKLPDGPFRGGNYSAKKN
jgi:amidase